MRERVVDPAASAGRRLVVVNADDLGLHEDINRGIREAHQKGIVTSASLAACGRAFHDALEVLHACPGLGVGIHLTLIEEEPLCKPEQIPSLLGADGRFHGSYRRFAKRIFWGEIWPDELRRELNAQIQRAFDSGIQPSHLDSHQHVHMLSPVWQVVAELAHGYHIPFIRIPSFQPVWVCAKDSWEYVSRIGLNALSWFRRRQSRAFKMADFTAGLHLSGRLKESDLLKVIQTLRPGLCEIVVHPGVTTPALKRRYAWGFDWSGELAALTSAEVQGAFRRADVCLVNYRDLVSSKIEE